MGQESNKKPPTEQASVGGLQFIYEHRLGFFLPILYAFPIIKSVKIVKQERYEANDHRQISKGSERRIDPKHNQNDVVCGVSERIKAASKNKQSGSEKTRKHGHGAHNQIVGVKITEYKIKHGGNGKRANDDKKHVHRGHGSHLHFTFALFRRIFKPRDTRDDRGRQAHTKVGNHFPVVSLFKRYDGIENGKTRHEKLPDDVPFCDKDKGSNAKERSEQGKWVKALAKEKGKGDRRHRATPKPPLKRRKIL